MVGPSSSHTAGAARIGLTARMLLGEAVVLADIHFHGSFAKTWRGHGTDRALIGGLMGMQVDDLRIRDSLHLAQEAGMTFTFSPIKLRDAHPNTVRLHLIGVSGRVLDMDAASVGGGLIKITRLDGMNVDFSGKENTLIIHHRDTPGVIAAVTTCLAENHVNIGTMQVYRHQVGADAMMVIELDSILDEGTLDSIHSLTDIQTAEFLKGRESQ